MTDQVVVPTVTVDGGPAPAPVAVPPAVATPTQAVVQDANAVAYGTDARGRKIGVKRFSRFTRRQVAKVISAETAEKPIVMQDYFVAACCVELNGQPIAFPPTETQFEHLCQSLDDDGLVAIAQILDTNFPVKVLEVKN